VAPTVSVEQVVERSREMLSTTGDDELDPALADLAAFLRDSGVRYDLLRDLPRTSHAELRSEPDSNRGKGLVAGGVVVQVDADAVSGHTAVVFWRNNRTCTFAVTPGSSNINRHQRVQFAGVAAQPYRWRNLAGRRVPCTVAVGYFQGN